MVPSGSKVRRLSCEYNLTWHCNLACSDCDHASPLLDERFASVASFARDLQALAPVLHTEQLRIVGGEPLLHPELLEFLRVARASALADQVVLITNGVLLHEAPEELFRLVDQLWVSDYPGVKRKLSLERCEQTCRDHGVGFLVRRDPQFQKTLLNHRVDDAAFTTAVFRTCKLANETSCHTIHEGRFYRCSVAPFMGPRLARLGIAFENEDDGVPLHDNPTLHEDLERCLGATAPLAACAYCLGTSGPDVPIRQLSKRGLAAWIAEDHRPLVEATRARLAQATSANGVSPRTAAPADPAATARLDVGRAELAALERTLAHERAEAAGLRDSLSWRITAPLRWGLDRVLALRRRLGPPWRRV